MILSGFHSANLLNFLDEVKVPIDCLIQFKSFNYDLAKSFGAEMEERERLENNLRANLKTNSKSLIT